MYLQLFAILGVYMIARCGFSEHSEPEALATVYFFIFCLYRYFRAVGNKYTVAYASGPEMVRLA